MSKTKRNESKTDNVPGEEALELAKRVLAPVKLFHVVSLVLVGVMGLEAQTAADLERLRKALEKRATAVEEAKAAAEISIPSELPSLDTLVVPLAKPSPAGRPGLPHFGYSFFEAKDPLLIWENLPAPSDYRLGPGDEIIVTLWGETQLRSRYVMDRDGNIFIDKVGLVNLAGKRLEDAEKQLRSRFERVYATLKNPKATTFMDITLGGLKSINVKFVGEVKSPGIHPVHPFSTVITGLIQAGGVNQTGSLRGIQVIRNNEVFSTVDLYAFLLKGKTDGDIRLRDQDVIFIPVRESTVTVDGAVQRPAIYEALEGETFASVLAYAGDVKAKAQTKLEVNRTLPFDQRLSDDVALESFYVDYSDIDNSSVRDGDRIVVHEILPMSRQVAIYGQVKKPGLYAYEDEMRLMDLLDLAGGIDDESYWKSVYSSRAEIIRRSEKEDYSAVIPVNLKALRDGDESQNIPLENLDQVVIRQSPYFDSPKNVILIGEVRIPGVYTLLRDGETLEEMIQRAGGFTERAFQEGIAMYRGKTRVVLRDFSIPVAGGDSVYVPEHPGTVFVMGEVYNQGLIHFKPGKSLKAYLESAGGFTPDANKGDISVMYANGDVKKRRWFSDPKVQEGATIVVYREKEREPFDTTEFLKETASITASLATIFFIIESRR